MNCANHMRPRRERHDTLCPFGNGGAYPRCVASSPQAAKKGVDIHSCPTSASPPASRFASLRRLPAAWPSRRPVQRERREAERRLERAGSSLRWGWAPPERWFTAACAAWYRDAGEKLRFDNIYLVNHLALAPPGAWPIDVGAYLEIQPPQDRSEGYAFLWGPTFQFDTASLQVNANVWLQRAVHAENASPTAFVYRWQAKGLVGPRLEVSATGVIRPLQSRHKPATRRPAMRTPVSA